MKLLPSNNELILYQKYLYELVFFGNLKVHVLFTTCKPLEINEFVLYTVRTYSIYTMFFQVIISTRHLKILW